MSPVINPNTADMEDLSSTEPGTYSARISEVATQNSKESGTPMVVPKFKIDVGGGKIKTRKAYVCITGPGSGSFDQLLRACHFDSLADQYADPDQENPPFDTDQLIDQELLVVIGNEDYEGETRDRIQRYLPA